MNNFQFLRKVKIENESNSELKIYNAVIESQTFIFKIIASLYIPLIVVFIGTLSLARVNIENITERGKEENLATMREMIEEERKNVQNLRNELKQDFSQMEKESKDVVFNAKLETQKITFFEARLSVLKDELASYYRTNKNLVQYKSLKEKIDVIKSNLSEELTNNILAKKVLVLSNKCKMGYMEVEVRGGDTNITTTSKFLLKCKVSESGL